MQELAQCLHFFFFAGTVIIGLFLPFLNSVMYCSVLSLKAFIDSTKSSAVCVTVKGTRISVKQAFKKVNLFEELQVNNIPV